MPDYGERYQAGFRISTGFAESAVNEIIAKRVPAAIVRFFILRTLRRCVFNQLQAFGSRPLPSIGRHDASLKALDLVAD
jgi:hypothetical protein